jgi:type II secretory ATPase GspE/PulE/Tfp pilus assembly ATPase PilB-like protein
MTLAEPISKNPQASPVTIVNSIIADAARRGASDIHVEPGTERVRVRYRIDGHMRYIAPLVNELLPSVVARVKILCGMDPAETRKPQDGGCVVPVEGKDLELRASTLPGNLGEIVVLRLLRRERELQEISKLGLNPDSLHDFQRLLRAQQGMVLITGPTGSGKTTTLYAALSHLNTDEVNIITVEDPIEVNIEGVNQVHVHDRAGRSYASTLRAMLRQDPDIIMVGEIRDLETAEIACRAALTGHLVLSTLHTQNTVGTLARLVDMQVPPYMVASSLNGVLAQRLVRRICDHCAVDHQPSPGLVRMLETQFGRPCEVRFRKGRGCNFCGGSGTRGRIGAFEILLMDDDLRRQMSTGCGPSELAAYLGRRGFRTMEEDAYRKACMGLITPEQVIELGMGLSIAPNCETDPELALLAPA